MIELTQNEVDSLRCNFGTLETGGRGQHTKYLPFAFTEQGIAMLSGLLNSDIAINMNIIIMRAFVMIRQYALNYTELNHKLDSFMLETNIQFSEIYQVLTEFAEYKKEQEEPRTPIGFKLNNK